LVEACPGILDRDAIHESPKICIEAAELFLNCKEASCIRDCGSDLQAVANDSWIGEEALNFILTIMCDL
jgi:hypothetical protein